jgi:hypothetical protein
VSSVVQSVKRHTDISVDLTLARRATGVIEHVQVLPDIGSGGVGKIGVQLQGNAEFVRKRVNGPVELLLQAGRETGKMLTGTASGLVSMVTNFDEAKGSVSGPVAVVAVGAGVARDSPAGVSHLAVPLAVLLQPSPPCCSYIAMLHQGMCRTAWVPLGHELSS